MLIKVSGAAVQGIDAYIVTIEASTSRGIRFFLVGLPDSAVKESHERIISAFHVNGYKFPSSQIIINMAPADIRQLDTSMLDDYVIMGEMSLDGSLQPVKGALSMAIKARAEGFKGIILPVQNAAEAAVIDGLEVFGADNLRQVVDLLNQRPGHIEPLDKDSVIKNVRPTGYQADFSDVKGQNAVKRALEVAASGGHNLIMIGPPGSGKSMMARALPSILPPLTEEESIETTRIHSVAGFTGNGTALITERPFRHPHHTISNVALTGGGSNGQPGEISLAHNGLLCPCGYYNHPTKECHCTPTVIERYLGKISGPLMDRFDIQCEILPVGFDDLSSDLKAETSAVIRERVIGARAVQAARFSDEKGIYCNAQMDSRLLRKYARAEPESIRLLGEAMNRLTLSARAYDRILKVARTIADMDRSDTVRPYHIAEAIGYRSLDRGSWGK